MCILLIRQRNSTKVHYNLFPLTYIIYSCTNSIIKTMYNLSAFFSPNNTYAISTETSYGVCLIGLLLTVISVCNLQLPSRSIDDMTGAHTHKHQSCHHCNDLPIYIYQH